jgi:predicted secreted hydrolase
VRRLIALCLAAVLTGSGCSAPILANGPIVFPTPVAATPAPSRPADPVAITFPRDDGPHDRLTEWWYYTGHLHTDDGRRFGFEAVAFRAERGSVPAAWAAHLALTDEQGATFYYAQRSEIGPQVDHSPSDGAGAPTGFDLQVGGLSPLLIDAGAAASAPPWRLAGSRGTDRIEAALTPDEARLAGASFGLQLDLQAGKPPALHDGDGFVDFGPAGSSYYYSRTRLEASGTLVVDGVPMAVEGIAWFDHQWGDFVSVGGGGWDWFAINLDDGTDLTFSVIHDAAGRPVLEYGTAVDANGQATRLDQLAFRIVATGTWRSPRSGNTYVAAWSVVIPSALPGGLRAITLVPTVVDQELDTRATTGVAYWEGSQQVEVTLPDQAIAFQRGGEAYVEMTRYDAGSP